MPPVTGAVAGVSGLDTGRRGATPVDSSFSEVADSPVPSCDGIE
jgi:hypothetical protein